MNLETPEWETPEIMTLEELDTYVGETPGQGGGLKDCPYCHKKIAPGKYEDHIRIDHPEQQLPTHS